MLEKTVKFTTIILFYLFIWPHHVPCGILVPQPVMEPRSLAVKVLSPNHWTTRKFPIFKKSNGLVFLLLPLAFELGLECFSLNPGKFPLVSFWGLHSEGEETDHWPGAPGEQGVRIWFPRSAYIQS